MAGLVFLRANYGASFPAPSPSLELLTLNCLELG
jgi:hypothetical protein